MKSKTLLLIVALAVIVIGGIYAVTRNKPEPAPTAETAQPAATPPRRPRRGGPCGRQHGLSTDANAPANQPAAQDCTQYSWDGVKWVCTSGPAA
ncbi:MAG: hypothetical protein HZT43_03460 [Exiguobacterium profundum]|nr:MAG: hypothetical protein HZT43_03460 [Exiguobacterium profundum]